MVGSSTGQLINCPEVYYEEITEQDPEPWIISLLNSATSSIWMSSDLSPNFYSRTAVKNAMLSAIDRVKEFHLLLDVSVNWNQRIGGLSWLKQKETEKKIEVKQSKENIPHWLMIDSNHFRLEKPHDQDVIKTSNLIIWNAKNVPSITMPLIADFQKWWTNGCIPNTDCAPQ